MTCSRPWHNLAGRTGIRAQAFMPHTSLLHIVLSLRLRNREGFGNRFPLYFFMLPWFSWGVKMKAGPHSVSIIDPSSLFSRVWDQLQICPFSRGCLPCLCNSCTGTDVTILGAIEDLQDSYGWEMLCKCKNNTSFLCWSLFILESLILPLLLWLLLFPWTFPFDTNSPLCKINCLLNGPIPIERQSRSTPILLLLLICF